MNTIQKVPAQSTGYETKVQERVLGQLIEAVLYEEIAVPLSGVPAAHFDGELALQGQTAEGEPVSYRFKAKRKFTFDRIRLARETIRRRQGSGEWGPATLAQFVEEVLGQAQKDGERLRMLLEELQSTLVKDAQAQAYRASLPPSGQKRSYDELESLLDGHPYHPCYKSRIGFSLEENARYGPEFGQELQPVWLAVAKAQSRLSLLEGEDYRAIIEYELGLETLSGFEAILTEKGLDAADYRFMPVHPWQWEHVITSAFQQQLADAVIVKLGNGPDVYFAQQSIRSWANAANKEKAYIKMALNITNTSTRRMLAKHTVLNAPLVSRWLLSLTEKDETVKKLGLVFLAEFAGITFEYGVLPAEAQPGAYGNLGVVWRQSVHRFLKDGEEAIPLSSVTYADGEKPFIDPWISRYGLKAWTRQLLHTAVTPLIHMLFAHGLAMESHAQNIVLIHKEGLPVRLALKDFHDGLRFSKAQLPQPEACPELNLEPAAHRAINRHSYMQTDDLDAVKDFLHSAFFFVCLGDIGIFMHERYGLEETDFWQMVADVIRQYEQEHPEHGASFAKYNLFSDTIRIEQLARRRLWKDMEVDPKHVPNPLAHYRFPQGGPARVKKESYGHKAEQRMMEDLVNTLLAEQFLDGHAGVELLTKSQWDVLAEQDAQMRAVHAHFGEGAGQATNVYRWQLADAVIVFPVSSAITQPYRFAAEDGVFKVKLHDANTHVTRMGPLKLMEDAFTLYANDPATVDPHGAEKLLLMIEQTLLQTSFSLENEQPGPPILGLPQAASLLEAERKAAYRDRPFHPVSKVKMGWTYDECSAYTAEFGRPIALSWMAVKQDYVVSGLDEGKELFPADLLLTEEERGRLSDEMNRRGLGDGAYTAIPVHPWQMSAILPEQIKRELEEGICIPLETQAGTFYATSSVRSLMPENESLYHVKLPLGIYSLGGLRYLSAIKLMNGQQAEGVMRKALERDAVLKRTLFLCDETKWWAYLPEDRDLFADYPRHLSTLIREYPAELVQDEDVRLLPMSALSVHEPKENGHIFDEWLRLIGAERCETSVVHLFRESLVTYFETCFRLFKLGMMPEVHGQNCVLVWKHGKIEGLLLRDHDALRVHVPWLNANGLEDPAYTLRKGYPNSLYHDKPEKLLTFFQMLGIQVNSYAILRCVSHYYGVSETLLWQELQSCLEEAMAKAELSAEVADVLHNALFKAAQWPWKQLVRPLLKKTTMRVPGSMPFGQGEVANPFHLLPAKPGVTKKAQLTSRG